MGANGKKPHPNAVERRKAYAKQYRKDNKEKRAEYNKQFRLTPVGIKTRSISSWKSQGLIGDYDSIYEIFLTTTVCDCCKESFPTQQQKHMDHNHETGAFRNILCRRCNQLRGHIDKDYKIIMKLLTL
jgi:hypothetical protein